MKNHLKLSLCFKTMNMLVASSVQVQGSSWKCSVDIVEQKREQRTHAAPKNSSSLLSSCPPHQLTQLQQTSPMLSNVCKYRQY